MAIRSVNRYPINKVDNIDSVKHAKAGNARVEKIEKLRPVDYGFNPTTLYLKELYDIIKAEKAEANKQDISKMDFEEFQDYLKKMQNEMKNSINTKNMNQEQILMLQDLFSSIQNNKNNINEIAPIVIKEQVKDFDVDEMRQFFKRNHQLFEESGILHFSISNIDEMEDSDILKIQNILVKKLVDVHDLFYYNKTFSAYEHSYQNMTEFDSNGLEA